MNTLPLTHHQELIDVNQKIADARLAIRDRRQAWADEMNAKLNIPKIGIDCGMWGRIMPYERSLCFKRWPEDNDLILLAVKRAELVKLVEQESKEALAY